MFTTALIFWDSLPIEGKLLIVLVLMQSIDIVTGVLAAGQLGVVSSKVSWKGASKKALTLCGVVVAVLVAAVAKSLPQLEGVPIDLTVASVQGWYIFTELLSIVESYARVGVDIPLLSPFAKRLAMVTRGDNSVKTVERAEEENRARHQ